MRTCLCFPRYRGDEVASDNQVNDDAIEDEAEELEDTGESSYFTLIRNKGLFSF